MGLQSGWLPCSVWLNVSNFREAGNSRHKEQHRKKSDVQVLWSESVEYVEFLSHKRSGVVSMDSTHEEDQTAK